MEFFELRDDGPRLSRVILGGHEYLQDGRSRGFNFAQAITPGAIVDGFGGPARQRIVAAALDLGINCFDVTIDSEKEALGRNLRDLAPPFDVFVQTRPEGMVYSYDPGNRRMLDLALLRDEVLRIVKLLGRDRIDILNFGYAAADSFSGPHTYAAMIASGAFDTVNINFNIAEDWPRDTAIPAAKAADCAVVVREALIKGDLFRLAGDLDVAATASLARGAIKWVAGTAGVDGVILGAASVAQLRESADAALKPNPTEDEQMTLDRTRQRPAFQDLQHEKNRLGDGGQP